MRVYLPEGRRTHHSITCTPAADERGGVLDGCSQWKDPATGAPIQYRVRFVDGVAEVDNLLGDWLIKHGYAARTRLILPRRRVAA